MALAVPSLSLLSPSSLLLLVAIPTSVFSSSLFLFIHNSEGGRETEEGEDRPAGICIFGKVAIRRGKRKSALRVVRDRFGADHARSNPAVPSCLSFGHFLSLQTLSSLNALKYSMHPYSSLEGVVISYPPELFACTSDFLFNERIASCVLD